MIETTLSKAGLAATMRGEVAQQRAAETEFRSRLLADAKRQIATRKQYKQYERFPGEIELLILKMKHRLLEIELI